MEKAIAQLDWTLYIECPECKQEFDLVEYDDGNEIAIDIFTNKWDNLEDYDIECPECKQEFKLERVQY